MDKITIQDIRRYLQIKNKKIALFTVYFEALVIKER